MVVATVAVSLTVLLRRSLRESSGDYSQELPDLSVYEIAYLTGGESRAVETAIASLADSRILATAALNTNFAVSNRLTTK